MAPSIPHPLASLSQREAITDVLHRGILACDLNDTALFDSVWAGEDVTFQINDDQERVLPNLTAIRKAIFGRVGPMDTTHNISMVRVDVKDGADTASVTATTMAQHSPAGKGREPDGPKYLVGGRYSLDLVKDQSGEWKAKTWVLDVIWTQGDASVMHPPA